MAGWIGRERAVSLAAQGGGKIPLRRLLTIAAARGE